MWKKCIYQFFFFWSWEIRIVCAYIWEEFSQIVISDNKSQRDGSCIVLWYCTAEAIVLATEINIELNKKSPVPKSDRFKWDIAMLVNWLTPHWILTWISWVITLKIPAEMCQLTRFFITNLNVFFVFGTELFYNSILPCIGNLSESSKLLFSTSRALCYYLVINVHTQRNIFQILLNQPEIRLHFSFSDWFGTKRKPICFHINRKMMNTILFWFDLIRFRKDFSLCETGKIPSKACRISV